MFASKVVVSFFQHSYAAILALDAMIQFNKSRIIHVLVELKSLFLVIACFFIECSYKFYGFDIIVCMKRRKRKRLFSRKVINLIVHE